MKRFPGSPFARRPRRLPRALWPALLAVAFLDVSLAPGSSAQSPPAGSQPPAVPTATPFPPAPPPVGLPPGGSLFPGAGSRPPPPPTGQVERTPAPGGGRRGSSGGQRSGGRRGRGENQSLVRAGESPLQTKVAFRRAKTEVLRDPVFAELLRRADAAPTDEDKRAFLRQYYVDLFARVRRLDPSPAMAAHTNLLARAAEARYAPTRQAGGEDERENTRGRNRR